MPPRPFLTQDQGVPNCILPSRNSHSHSHPPQTPQNVNQEKLTEINISQEQRKKGGGRERREPSPKMLPGFKGGQTRTPPHGSAGERGHSLQLQNLGCGGLPPRKIQGDLQQKKVISAETSQCWGNSEGDQALECQDDAPGGAVPHRAGARCLPPALVAWGATVPTLASAGTPLTAAATTQDTHQTTQEATPTSGTFGPFQNSSQSHAGQAGLVIDRRPYLCWSRGEGWGEGRRRSAGE